MFPRPRFSSSCSRSCPIRSPSLFIDEDGLADADVEAYVDVFSWPYENGDEEEEYEDGPK